jgi:leucyl aminopeptidase (aminopeptidase T)
LENPNSPFTRVIGTLALAQLAARSISMAEYSDVSVNLRPELLKVVHFIFKEQCNLQPGWRVLLICDSHTPQHVSTAFTGVAMQFGAEVVELRIPMGPHPAYQPGYTWDPLISKTVLAAAEHADLIVDMAVGYADFMVEIVRRGKTRIIGPGDATGAPHIDDSLIRCLLLDDPFQIRREAIQVAAAMTQGKLLRVTSREGSDYTVDISDLKGDTFDGFLWDRDSKQWVSNYQFTPGATPGVVIPKGRGDGVLAIDGLMLYENVHHIPREPVLLKIQRGKITDISGDAYVCNRLVDWLENLNDQGCRNGPIHANIGLSRHARLTEHLEWERMRGGMVFGIGDNSLLAPFVGANFETSKSGVHWDVQVLRPTVTVDGRALVENGIVKLNPGSSS